MATGILKIARRFFPKFVALKILEKKICAVKSKHFRISIKKSNKQQESIIGYHFKSKIKTICDDIANFCAFFFKSGKS